MPEGIQSTVRLFADDTIAYVTISSDADAANLRYSGLYGYGGRCFTLHYY
jgi:hypothetical protein